MIHSGQLSSCFMVMWISWLSILISVSALQCGHALVLVFSPSCLANCSLMFMGFSYRWVSWFSFSLSLGP